MRWWGQRRVATTVLVMVVVMMMVEAGTRSYASTRVVVPKKAWAHRSLRQVAADCNSPSCCGYTESSVGCRYQGHRCRCPFLVPRPIPISNFSGILALTRRRPSTRQDDQDEC
nr:uncharacterized protein LOC128702633 [Cherax quadricarinatus]XP_053652936.1 uncharacterized protein LOC128702633 [Cherax quadricarinatus]